MEDQKPNQGAADSHEHEHDGSVMMPPASGPLAKLETWLYSITVTKAPYQLPKNAKDFIVKYGPWITLVLGILLALTVVPGLIAALALTSYTATYGGLYGATLAGGVVGPIFYLSLIFLVIQLIIMFVSIPMLLKRRRIGWQLVFYSSVISLVYTVFNSFSYGILNFGSLVVGLIGALIGWYFIFQIRSYYT